MKAKLRQEPAFPITDAYLAGQLIKNNQSPEGMSKRFYAACAAMRGLISNGTFNLYEPETPSQIAHKAYGIADELLKQENE